MENQPNHTEQITEDAPTALTPLAAPSQDVIKALLPPVPPSNRSDSDKSKQIRKPERRNGRLDKHVDRINSQLIDKLGSKEEISEALASASDPKSRKFLELLIDPRNHETPIARLARRAGMEPIQLAQIMRNHYSAQSMVTFMKNAPVIAEDIVADAKSIQIECPRCNGFGRVQDPFTVTEENPTGDVIDCVRCGGSGLVRKSGDRDARQLMAETIRWTKNKGTSVTVNNISMGGIDSIVDQMESALEPDNPRHRLDRTNNSQIIDVEVVEPTQQADDSGDTGENETDAANES